MAISTAKLANYYIHCADPKYKPIYRELLIESLSEQHYQVFNFVDLSSGIVYSSDIMALLDCTENHAGLLLKRLTDYGLLVRKRAVSEQCVKYEYRTKPQEAS